MSNKKNLISLKDRSPQERHEISQKGAKASNEAQKKRKALRESMNVLLELPISSTADYNAVAKMGIPIEDIDNSQLIVLALFKKAKSGDVQAIDKLARLIGEDTSPTDELSKLDEVLKKIGGNL